MGFLESDEKKKQKTKKNKYYVMFTSLNGKAVVHKANSSQVRILG